MAYVACSRTENHLRVDAERHVDVTMTGAPATPLRGLLENRSVVLDASESAYTSKAATRAPNEGRECLILPRYAGWTRKGLLGGKAAQKPLRCVCCPRPPLIRERPALREYDELRRLGRRVPIVENSDVHAIGDAVALNSYERSPATADVERRYRAIGRRHVNSISAATAAGSAYGCSGEARGLFTWGAFNDDVHAVCNIVSFHACERCPAAADRERHYRTIDLRYVNV